MHSIGVVGVRVVGPRIGVPYVSCGHDEQARIRTIAVEVHRERIDCRRPGGRTPTIATIPSRYRHPVDPAASRSRDLGPRHRFHRQIPVVTRTRSGNASQRDELDRFETVLNLHRTGTGEEFIQVTHESEARHLRPVTFSVVGAPVGFHSVEVNCIQSGADKRMAAVDAGVEQTRMGRVVGVPRELGSMEEVVEPFGLFIAFQRIEEFRRFLRASQLGNAVERDHGALHASHRSACH